MMEKAVIFGAGVQGQANLVKLKYQYDIVAFSDNNERLWGSTVKGIPVIPPQELAALDAVAFICISRHWREIAKQLDGLGVQHIVMEECLSYRLVEQRMFPQPLGKMVPYKKDSSDDFSVLFVQQWFCTRTNKIASVLKAIGVKTYAAFQMTPSNEGDAFYSQLPFFTYASLMEYVNNSEFDIIHCSNEDDTLTNLLLHSNKKVIFDCHDIITEAYPYIRYEKFVLEYIANTQSDGIITFSEPAKAILCKKYDLNPNKVLAIGNYPSKSLVPQKRLEKLSAKDGGIHCVYEGGVVDKVQANDIEYRFYEPIFLQLAQSGIHIHIYSSSVPEYLTQLDKAHALIHYEGSCNSQELITKLTQYDVGIALYLSDLLNYLGLISPNKMFEYLAAGLPVVSNVKELAGLMEANHCGGMLDLEHDNIFERLQEYQKISLSPDFCDTHKFTMDANAESILEFYKRILVS